MGRGPAPFQPPVDDRRPLRLRRLLLLALVLLGAWVGTSAMADVLPNRGQGFEEIGLLILFGILFGWISAGFWTGLMGAIELLRGPGRGPLARRVADAPLLPLDPGVRTAIIMPICNEHVPTVFGGLAATIESLRATGESAAFDVFVLSDSNDPDIRAAEQAAWSDLAGRLAAEAGGDPQALRLHYRWRQRRTQRKAGNVADFCRRWGGAYRYFVVLDADSVMTGECLTTLVRMMEAHPDAGIIQTAPKAVGHDTFHARVQQFCARAYGPLFTAGMRFWQLGESHYWGHNAILRMEPFVRHCALAPIEGSGSLSGHILSHDFVEAALMRRAGWKVWVADELDGSYEQVPPNLLAELQRDRRWCHGNLQNSRLMFEPGLHAVHRTAFLTGVLAYASSPLWLAFLLLSTLLFARQAGVDPTYFFEPNQLFPIWPTANLKLMLTLFGLTAVLLLAPKVLSLLAIVGRGEARRFGGTRRLIGSALVEFAHSLLLAPVRMLFHTQFVLAALTGWRLDWKSPPRDDASTGWLEATWRHGAHTLLAVLWIVAIVVSSNSFAWWLTPILLGLLLATPLSVWGSRVAAGRSPAPARPVADAGRDSPAPGACRGGTRSRRGRRTADDVQGRDRRSGRSTRASPRRCRSAPCIGPEVRGRSGARRTGAARGPRGALDRRALPPALEPEGAGAAEHRGRGASCPSRLVAGAAGRASGPAAPDRARSAGRPGRGPLTGPTVFR